MKEITIRITEQQEKFLKQFAVNHYPGAKDNLATHQPIHIVQSKRINYIPYSPDNAEFYDHLPVTFKCFNCEPAKWAENEVELVQEYYKNKGEDPPIQIKPFTDMQCSEVHCKDGSDFFVYDYNDYFKAYGIENVAIAWKEEVYEDVAYFFILDEARKYKEYQAHNLKEPRTYTSSGGYGNEGEYHHFWNLLFKLGEQLNAESKSKNLATDAS